MKFCFKNNIILCRLPSHTSHKLQPYDVRVIGPLQIAYREQVEQLYRGGANTVGKQHFTLLYSRARDMTFTSRNIKSVSSKTGMCSFNPNRVLQAIQKPQVEEAFLQTPHPSTHLLNDDLLPTPVIFESLTSLRTKLE